jgi:hypothetical protein
MAFESGLQLPAGSDARKSECAHRDRHDLLQRPAAGAAGTCSISDARFGAGDRARQDGGETPSGLRRSETSRCWRENDLDIGIPQMLGAWAERTRARSGWRGPSCKRPPGHPARGRRDVAAGLLARGSSPLSWPSRRFIGASDRSSTAARRLQLRGQRRPYPFGCTGFPLSSGPSKGPENHDGGICGRWPTNVNLHLDPEPWLALPVTLRGSLVERGLCPRPARTSGCRDRCNWRRDG